MDEPRMRQAGIPARLRSIGGAMGLLIGGLALLTVAACVGPGQPSTDIATVEHMCSSCHGINGSSESPNFPRLAGQQKSYIIRQLTTFKDRSRADPRAGTYMWGMAAGLSPELIEQLATDYAAMAPAPGTPGDPADMAAGELIYRNGVPYRNVPACVRCHGQRAEGDDQHPRLAGQHPAYLERQITYFAQNSRLNTDMHKNSVNLTEAEAHEVATYLAAQ